MLILCRMSYFLIHVRLGDKTHTPSRTILWLFTVNALSDLHNLSPYWQTHSSLVAEWHTFFPARCHISHTLLHRLSTWLVWDYKQALPKTRVSWAGVPSSAPQSVSFGSVKTHTGRANSGLGLVFSWSYCFPSGSLSAIYNQNGASGLQTLLLYVHSYEGVYRAWTHITPNKPRADPGQKICVVLPHGTRVSGAIKMINKNILRRVRKYVMKQRPAETEATQTQQPLIMKSLSDH